MEEIKYSDLIVHVIDASSKDLEIAYDTTMNILQEIGIKDKKILTVFNKSDKIDLNSTTIPLKIKSQKIYISAKNDPDMNKLLKSIEENLPEQYIYTKLNFPYDDTDILYKLIERFDLKPIYKENFIEIELSLSKKEYNKLKRYVANV